MANCERYNNLRALFRLRDLLSELNPQGPPTVRVVKDDGNARKARIGVLAGSFNPLTVAHIGLIRAARRSAHLSTCYFLLSRATVDKERISGALLEDRLRLLERYSATRSGFGVFVVNRGLYIDQAVAIRSAIPSLESLHFIVGFDKIVQVFDPRYYQDRDAALRELFTLASFLVAPRAGYAKAEDLSTALATLLSRPENWEFRDRVTALPAPRGIEKLSSTLVREEIERGQWPIADAPREVREWIAETGAYQPSTRLPNGEQVDKYAVRSLLIDLLDRDRRWALRNASLPQLLRQAWDNAPSGAEFRRSISNQDILMAVRANSHFASLTKS